MLGLGVVMGAKNYSPRQVLVNELQQRLSNLDSELGTLRDKTRQAEARANSLQNEKALLTSTEQRSLRTVEELSMEKHKLSAQLHVEQKVREQTACMVDLNSMPLESVKRFLAAIILGLL